MSVLARGLSLWWIPDEPVFGQLAGVMDALARAHGTPAFEPHVTVLGGITDPEDEVLRRALALAAGLAPLRLALGAYGHERVPTRWLFRFVVPDPEVLAANERARACFPSLADKPYTPHLSLMYGDQDDALAQAVISADPAPPLAFEARTLHVVRTEGPPAAWRRLACYPLGSQSPGSSSSSPWRHQ